MSSIENDLLYREPIDIAFIFTNAVKNYGLQYNLRIAVSSLLNATKAPLRLNLITDEDGIHIASDIIKEIQTKEHLEKQHVKV